VASVFAYEGPPATLVKKMKHGAKPYLAEGAAAWMAVQFFKLGWPKPDLITAPPISWLKQMDRGYNQSALIGESLSNYLECPYSDLLHRSIGGYSQAALTKEHRQKMEHNLYRLKRRVDIADKRILLVDDVMTTGATLKRCAEALYEGCPASLYALTFCKA
jgi:ComF family protein